MNRSRRPSSSSRSAFDRRSLRPCVEVVLAFAWSSVVAAPLTAQDYPAPTPPGVGQSAVDEGSLEAVATWRLPSDREIGERLATAARDSGWPEDRIAELVAPWLGGSEGAAGNDPLGRTLESISLVRPEARPVADAYLGSVRFATIDGAILASFETAPWMRTQLQAALGIVAVRSDLHDEGLALLDPLDPAETVDPAEVLFRRAIARQQLVRGGEAIEDLKRLLEREADLARRHREVGKLMLADLEALEADSLDEISRLMRDVRRRQSLYRSGRRVLEQEEEVIEKLDKLIEELEQQQQQQAAAATLAPSSPAQDTVLKGAPAPGEVDRRRQGSGEDWGNLPARERAAAMAELSKQLPSHYRELIEEYFRKLAVDPDEESGN